MKLDSDTRDKLKGLKFETISLVERGENDSDPLFSLNDKATDQIMDLFQSIFDKAIEKETAEDNLAMLTYLIDDVSEPVYLNGKMTKKGWVCNTSSNAVEVIKIETERRKLIKSIKSLEKKS